MSAGKRAGARRAVKPKRSLAPSLKRPPSALLYSLGITACVVAWGYLVYMAIDFGANARSGQGAAWGLLALASLGAVACLFVALMLVARLLRVLGVTKDDAPSDSVSTPPVEAQSPAASSARTDATVVDLPTRSGPGADAAPAVPLPRRTPAGGRRAAR